MFPLLSNIEYVATSSPYGLYSTTVGTYGYIDGILHLHGIDIHRSSLMGFITTVYKACKYLPKGKPVDICKALLGIYGDTYES